MQFANLISFLVLKLVIPCIFILYFTLEVYTGSTFSENEIDQLRYLNMVKMSQKH